MRTALIIAGLLGLGVGGYALFQRQTAPITAEDQAHEASQTARETLKSAAGSVADAVAQDIRDAVGQRRKAAASVVEIAANSVGGGADRIWEGVENSST